MIKGLRPLPGGWGGAGGGGGGGGGGRIPNDYTLQHRAEGGEDA